MLTCITCGGEGLEGESCPECGKTKGSLNLHLVKAEEYISVMKDLYIPDRYIGLEWSKSELLKRHEDKVNDFNFIRFCEQLEKVNAIFSTGILPNKSALVIAPSMCSKEIFAYSCMQHAKRNNFTIAPLLDTLEVKRLLVLASENPNYKLYNKFSYDEYISSDVLFVTCTKTQYYKDSYQTIAELISRRERLGLSTFVISRYSVEEMSSWDKRCDFKKLLRSDNSDSALKYPAVISYREVK